MNLISSLDSVVLLSYSSLGFCSVSVKKASNTYTIFPSCLIPTHSPVTCFPLSVISSITPVFSTIVTTVLYLNLLITFPLGFFL